MYYSKDRGLITEDFKITVKAKPGKELDIQAEGDEAEEAKTFVKALLGENHAFFDSEFSEPSEEKESEDAEEIDSSALEADSQDTPEVPANPFAMDFEIKEPAEESEKDVKEDFQEIDDQADWEDFPDETKPIDNCPKCGRRLNDGGTCPWCEDGEAEDMSDEDFLEALGQAIVENRRKTCN